MAGPMRASSKSTNSDSDSGSNTEVSTPVNDVIISNVTVETYGVDYGIPETVEEFDMNSWYTNFLMQKYGYSQQ